MPFYNDDLSFLLRWSPLLIGVPVVLMLAIGGWKVRSRSVRWRMFFAMLGVELMVAGLGRRSRIEYHYYVFAIGLIAALLTRTHSIFAKQTNGRER